MSDFHLQGAVPVYSAAYVPRSFEDEVYQNVMAGKWVLVLGPRQHGKTTGLLRVRAKFEDTGIRCVLIDMQSMSSSEGFEDVLDGFSKSVAHKFGVQNRTIPADIDRGQLSAWLTSSIPYGNEPLVIIIDEASAISDPEWRNTFYGQIRSIANERASAASGTLPARLRFIFAGCFRPETLIANTNNSPFNVSTTVETDDLTLEMARTLNKKIVEQEETTFVDQAFNLVGGQPFLIQYILSRTYASVEQDKQVSFDKAIESLRAGDDNHFQALFGHILSESHLTALVSKMCTEGRIVNDATSADHKFLRTLGIAKRIDTFLVFRNQIYQEFAQNSTQLGIQPVGSPRPVAQILPLPEWYGFMRSPELKEIAYSMELGAVSAYNSGSYRLALGGFGSALEAVLIDWLSSLNPAVLATAVARAGVGRRFERNENPTNPSTWRLVNLISVSIRAAAAVNITEPPDSIREWRNTIHPGVAIRRYMPEKDMAPEALAASALLTIARRDIAKVI